MVWGHPKTHVSFEHEVVPNTVLRCRHAHIDTFSIIMSKYYKMTGCGGGAQMEANQQCEMYIIHCGHYILPYIALPSIPIRLHRPHQTTDMDA